MKNLRTFTCLKHRVAFLTVQVGFGYGGFVRRCPVCVNEAAALVRRARDEGNATKMATAPLFHGLPARVA